MKFTKAFPDHSYMNLIDKKVKILCVDKTENVGTVIGFDSSLNNYMGAASVCLHCDSFPYSSVEILETEIESITLAEEN